LKPRLISNSSPITSFIIDEEKVYGSSKIKLIWRCLLEVSSVSRLEQKILGEMHNRIVRSFLDIVILQALERGPLGCYDVVSLIRDKYDVSLSPGKTYSCLYTLEKEGLVQSELNSNKRIFRVTDQGKDVIRELSREKTKIFGMLLRLFEEK
jgi:DNA-binding PadR family transcriptional regulator